MTRYANKKTGHDYLTVALVYNATNAQDGERMVLYTRNRCWIDAAIVFVARQVLRLIPACYVRERLEFHEKFLPIDKKD